VLIGATLVTPRAGEIVGELVLAIKLATPLSAAGRRHPSVSRVQPRPWTGSRGARREGRIRKGDRHEQYAAQQLNTT
jgi:hypothetical protein